MQNHALFIYHARPEEVAAAANPGDIFILNLHDARPEFAMYLDSGFTVASHTFTPLSDGGAMVTAWLQRTVSAPDTAADV